MTARVLSMTDHLERQRRQFEREEVRRRLNRWSDPHQGRQTLDEIMGTGPCPPRGGGEAA